MFLLLHWSRETKDIVFGFVTGVIFLGFWTVLAVEDFAQDAALKVRFHHVSMNNC